MEQAIGGGHLCSAVRRKRRRAPAGDHGTRIRSSAERDRPEASHAAQALSPVRLRKTNLYHFVLGKNKVSRCTTYLLVALRCEPSSGRSKDPTTDGAGSDGATGSRAHRAK